ncbi:MAG TPA: hypothetical protein VN765_03020 [Candidatus Acidoferrum sp.]|nr:hypothetical protein [Candidatus Acidoferrum sp.]
MNQIRLGFQILGFAAVFLTAGAVTARAMLRGVYDDATVVERSEMIVVGHLKANSIRFIFHTNMPAQAAPAVASLKTNSIQIIWPTYNTFEPDQNGPLDDLFRATSTWWEHRAILVVTEVIKGKSTTNEIPIIIHYGLKPTIAQPEPPKETNKLVISYGPEPVAHGNAKPSDFMTDEGGGREDYSTNRVQIIDRAGPPVHGIVVEDVGKDNLWFLRRGSGVFGEVPGTNDLGVMDPQDMQPLKLKDYFEFYLSKNPEEALKSYAAKHPELSRSVESALNHLKSLSQAK